MDLKIKNKQIIFIFLGEGGNVFTTLLFQEKRLNQPNSKGGKTYLFCLKIILGILWRFSGEDSALSLPRTWVQSLIRILRSCKSGSAAKKKGSKCISSLKKKLYLL